MRKFEVIITESRMEVIRCWDVGKRGGKKLSGLSVARDLEEEILGLEEEI